MDTNKIAGRFGVSPDRIREQFRRNAEQLESMAAKARASGRKVNGYTADELDRLAAQTRARAAE